MTPGPWRGQERMDRRGYTVERHTGQVVAHCDNPSDARAIAEVPAMVEVLKAILEPCVDYGEWCECQRDARNDARAILARIEGRE